MDTNNVILIGRLTTNPDYRVTSKGNPVTKFSLANSGLGKDDTLFIDCVAFSKTAEVVRQYCNKGQQVCVVGRLQLEKWQDKQTGTNKSKISLLVNSVQMIGSKPQEKSIQQPTAKEIWGEPYHYEYEDEKGNKTNEDIVF
ncbi:single-stranded DNA-binding protein [Methanobrevibacter sp.]|uniref:single-stranded DNA-binding protein n=1 Tax=Methanobrevibacter sp. TaxID=66852 RepID=UPI003890290B